MVDQSEGDITQQFTFPPEAAEEFLAQAPMGAGIVSVPSLRILAANRLFGQLLGLDGPPSAPLPARLSEGMAACLLPLLERTAAGAILREEIRGRKPGTAGWRSGWVRPVA